MKPIIFNTEMVRAILDGRKTMTRRVIKPYPEGAHTIMDYEDGVWSFMCGNQGEGGAFMDWEECRKEPYQPGDVLWVRETWGMLYGFASGEWEKLFPGKEPPDASDNVYCYKADYSDASIQYMKEKGDGWRPSIYMPREAARIFLRVKDVRVERLQEISEADAKREGYPFSYKAGMPIHDFIFLWNSINAKRGYGWDTNPWVWVVEFERCERP